jgi:hypothetical protein
VLFIYTLWYAGPSDEWYSVRERLKDILRQYELRERHFECVIRSKELEVLLSRARAAEQKQLAEGEKSRSERLEEEVRIIPDHTSPLNCISSVVAESANSEGAGRCAEGSDDVGRETNFVLQRGTHTNLIFFAGFVSLARSS